MRLTLMSHLWFIGWIGLVFSWIYDDIRLNKNIQDSARVGHCLRVPTSYQESRALQPVEQLLQLI